MICICGGVYYLVAESGNLHGLAYAAIYQCAGCDGYMQYTMEVV